MDECACELFLGPAATHNLQYTKSTNTYTCMVGIPHFVHGFSGSQSPST